MSGHVYVLKAICNGRYYIGSTDHLIRRYHQHANGAVHTRARMLPVCVAGWKEFETLTVARQAERALKKKKSRVDVEFWLKSQNMPM